MDTGALQTLAEELSAYARGFEGVTRETIIKPVAKGGGKKAGTEDKLSGPNGVSITILQTADGIQMKTGDRFRPGGMVTPEDALRAAHGRLDDALDGLRNGASETEEK